MDEFQTKNIAFLSVLTFTKQSIKNNNKILTPKMKRNESKLIEISFGQAIKWSQCLFINFQNKKVMKLCDFFLFMI